MAIYLGTNNLAGLGGGSRETHNTTTTSLSYPDISYMPALVINSSGEKLSSESLQSQDLTGGTMDTTSSDYFNTNIPAGAGAVTNQDILNLTNSNGGALTNLVLKTAASIYYQGSSANTLGRPALTIDFIVDGTTTTFVTPTSIKTMSVNSKFYYTYQFISFGGYNLLSNPNTAFVSGTSQAYAYSETVETPHLMTFPNFNTAGGFGGSSGFTNTSFTNNMIRTTKKHSLGNSYEPMKYTYLQYPVKYHWGFGFPWLKFNSSLQIRVSAPATSNNAESGVIYAYGMKHTF